jgi:hypothetical protein
MNMPTPQTSTLFALLSTCGDMRNNKLWSEFLEGRPRHRRQYNIKIDLYVVVVVVASL